MKGSCAVTNLAAESRADTWQHGGHTSIVSTPQEQALLPHVVHESPQLASNRGGVPAGVRGRVASQTGLLHARVRT